MNYFMKTAIFTGFCMAFCTICTAAPITTDRPDFTESSATVELGYVQLEGGYTYTKTDNANSQSVGELLMRLPLIKGIEARVGINSILFSDTQSGNQSGLEDSSVGFKIAIVEDQKAFLPQTALIVDTSLPTGGNPYRKDRLQPGAKVCVGWALSDQWALSSNLGYSRLFDDAHYNEFTQSISLATTFLENWGAYFEFFGIQTSLDDDDNLSYFNTGLTYIIQDNYQLDARIGHGFNGQDSDYFIGLGLSARFSL